ncbi:MAG: GntR family transcriptional regulator [Tissierellia bacterium]|nr:GntR family transcriptional regulator [Tissierellia bacterium]
MEFNSNVPIYLQIADFIRRKIAGKEWHPGEQLPTVRQLGLDLKVNPNTVQRAFTLLEQEGYVESKRTAGRFVTMDKKNLEKLKTELAYDEVLKFLVKMKELGFEKDKVLLLVNEKWEDKDGREVK